MNKKNKLHIALRVPPKQIELVVPFESIPPGIYKFHICFFSMLCYKDSTTRMWYFNLEKFYEEIEAGNIKITYE